MSSPTSRTLELLRRQGWTAAVVERFIEKVSPEPNSGCWLWTAAVDKHTGYGAFNIGMGRRDSAHRVSWWLAGGSVAIGNQLDHLCRVRTCVNPRHLEEVTPRENWMRGQSVTRRRSLLTVCPRGHAYAGDNLRVDDYGGRHCKTCDRQYRTNARRRRQ